jgi:hypothetical protein
LRSDFPEGAVAPGVDGDPGLDGLRIRQRTTGDRRIELIEKVRAIGFGNLSGGTKHDRKNEHPLQDWKGWCPGNRHDVRLDFIQPKNPNCNL